MAKTPSIGKRVLHGVAVVAGVGLMAANAASDAGTRAVNNWLKTDDRSPQLPAINHTQSPSEATLPNLPRP